jgi:signal transduction histidine kinase
LEGLALDCKPVARSDLDHIDVDRKSVEGLGLVGGRVGVAELGLNTVPRRSRGRLGLRVGVLVAAQLCVATAFAILAIRQGDPIGLPAFVLALTGSFVVAGAFDASLDFTRHKFTFTPSDAVLVVGLFAVGPVGLAAAFAVAEAVNMAAHRSEPLKGVFNVANRLAAVMVAAVAFQALGHTDAHDATAWVAALAAVVLFSLLDVAATAVAVSMAEQVRFRQVFVRSASTGVLATLAAAPIGLVALDLYLHGPFAVLLLVPLAIAVMLNSRYAVAQRDEHLRFERLYATSARTAGLVSFDDALRSLAAEARALITGVAALCCATDANGRTVGAWSRDPFPQFASPEAITAALDFARRSPDREIDVQDAPAVGGLVAGAGSVLAVASVHEKAGRVVLVVFRDGPSDGGAQSRVETLGAFANHAALIVANALMHEEVAVALARQVDLNHQKDDFIAAVSHELRTPLAVILGSVQTLDRLNDTLSDTQRAELFDMTEVQGGRLQRLIDELLLVAAAEHAAVPIERDVVDVAELLMSVEADTATATAGRLVRRLDDRVEIVTDRSKLARVLLNLVENAAKYAPSGPIELAATYDGDGVCFQILDHGPGIAAQDATRAFEQFVQLDQSSTRSRGGTGLGLHLCNQLAKLLDGRIDLDETPGGGCTFRLRLPAAPTTPAPARPEPQATQPLPEGVLARPVPLNNESPR